MNYPGESTRLVSEYKNKLQLADSETARLQGTVSGRGTCVGGAHLCAVLYANMIFNN